MDHLLAAAGELNMTYVKNTFGSITTIINDYLVPLIFALAFVAFLWGVYKYFILGAANEEKRAEGAKFAAYALVGFFLMLSVWGLVNVLRGTIQLDNTAPKPPGFGDSSDNAKSVIPPADNTNTQPDYFNSSMQT